MVLALSHLMPYLVFVAGSSVRPPLFGTLYFDDQAMVDDFVLNYDVEPSVSSKV